MSVPRQVRAVDVAKAAGVSTATVSYVLNNSTKQKISPETQERVRDAAKRLGYISNAAAQTLARGKSSFLIVDMTEFATEESAAIASAPILSTLRTLGYEPFMSWWPTDSGPAYHHDQLVRFARATRAEGVISVLPLPTKLISRLRAVGVRTTASLVADPMELLLAIQTPVTTQVEYLAGAGHSEIFYVASNNPTLSLLADARQAAGHAVAERRSLRWIPVQRHENTKDLARILQQAMAKHPEATAIAAYNDMDAIASLFALHSINVGFPNG